MSQFRGDDIEERLEFSWFRLEEAESVRAIRLALIDALEVRITREDPDAPVDPIDFTWDIVSYSQRQIVI